MAYCLLPQFCLKSAQSNGCAIGELKPRRDIPQRDSRYTLSREKSWKEIGLNGNVETDTGSIKRDTPLWLKQSKNPIGRFERLKENLKLHADWGSEEHHRDSQPTPMHWLPEFPFPINRNIV